MKRSSSWIAVLPSLVIPVCIGLILYLGLSALINQGVISNELLLRYLTGHPVSEVTIAMFFVGIASLGLISKNIFEQYGAERKITLEPESQGEAGEAVTLDASKPADQSENDGDAEIEVGDRALTLGKRLAELPVWMQEHYLWQRLSNALRSIDRTNSTSSVEDELKYLADLDLDRQQQRYSLVRILIWATPMLGFLGTVLGISQALGGINVGPDNDFQQMMNGLRGSLYVAFDTTALALTLSIILMFGQFLIERFEAQLLVLVDQRSKAEMAAQFDMTIEEKTGFEHLASEVVSANRETAEQQTEIWRKSIHAAERAWVNTLTQANSKVQEGLSESLDENVSSLAHYLGEAIDRADHAMSHRWEQWQVTLSDNARQMEAQQKRLSQQTEVVTELMEEIKASNQVQPESIEPAAAVEDRESQSTTTVGKDVESNEESAETDATSSHVMDENKSDVVTSVEEAETVTESEAPVGTSVDTNSGQPLSNQPLPDVTFELPTSKRRSRDIIRFENYQKPVTRKNSAQSVESADAEVILPFRTVARRAASRKKSSSKKSA